MHIIKPIGTDIPSISRIETNFNSSATLSSINIVYLIIGRVEHL